VPAQEILRGIERDDVPLLQHRDAPAQGLGLFQIVRRQHDRVAFAVQLPDESP
jgi:hypothetical protein